MLSVPVSKYAGGEWLAAWRTRVLADFLECVGEGWKGTISSLLPSPVVKNQDSLSVFRGGMFLGSMWNPNKITLHLIRRSLSRLRALQSGLSPSRFLTGGILISLQFRRVVGSLVPWVRNRDLYGSAEPGLALTWERGNGGFYIVDFSAYHG